MASNKSCSSSSVSNKTSSSGKPLNPMASPYHKLSKLNYYHHHVYFSNLTHIPPPLCVSKKNKKAGLSPFAPVALGPRLPKGSRRKLISNHFPNSSSPALGGAYKLHVWVPKKDLIQKPSTTTTAGSVHVAKKHPFIMRGSIRWKNNKSRGYQDALPLNEDTTCIMIKNIPNKYTRELMVKTLDNHCKTDNKNTTPDDVSAYDFLYLPIDFHRRVNAGFAFVNFTTPEAALRFRDAFHGKRWDLFGSPKIAEISRARIQGKKALICHCKSMDFSNGSEEDMPVYFEPARDGSAQACCYKMFTVGLFSY